MRNNIDTTLAAVSIAAVVCFLVVVVVSAVTKLLVQLRLQAVLRNFGDRLLEQRLDVRLLQQLPKFFSTGIFLWCTFLSSHF